MNWSGNDFINGLSATGPASRVWIYQSPRHISPEQKKVIMEMAAEFLKKWNTHGTFLAADFGLLFDHFLVFVADEEKVKASGCSIDQSVSLVRDISEATGINLFDRHSVAYADRDEIKTARLDSLGELLTRGIISPETPVFNNLVQDLTEMKNSWIIPFSQSWHFRYADARA